MTNFTFEERLIREHRPEPLEGHTVVVLERVGEAGEKFHTLLEPGAPPPRKGLFATIIGRPNPFFAFAVDATRERPCTFAEHVQMAEQAHEFHLQFTLWYRVGDARLVVSARTADPLGRVRRKVAQVVTEEVADLTWAEVSQSFRAAGEMVVDRTLPELQAFARDYGIQILSLQLRARLPAAARQTDIDIHAVREKERLDAVRLSSARNLLNVRSDLRRDNAGRDDEDRADSARRAYEDTLARATTEKVGELVAQAGSIGELREVHAGLGSGGGGGGGGAGPLGVPAFQPSAPVRGVLGPSTHTPGAVGLGGVLAELVATTQRIGVDGQRRRVRAALLHLVASVVGDDSGEVTPEQTGHARTARAAVDDTRVDPDVLEALRTLADAADLRDRIYP